MSTLNKSGADLDVSLAGNESSDQVSFGTFVFNSPHFHQVPTAVGFEPSNVGSLVDCFTSCIPATALVKAGSNLPAILVWSTIVGQWTSSATKRES